MASQARSAFIRGWNSCRSAVDQANVLASDDMGAFLRRGITVSAYNLLETFVAERLSELAAYVNGGHTQFLDLPERLQRQAITNTLNVANARLRWRRLSIVDLRSFSADVGGSLNAVGMTLKLSPMTWTWPGSNMGPNDFASALSFLHVDSAWLHVRKLAGRLGYPTTDPVGQPLDYEADLDSLAKERHSCAHIADHPVTAVWLRSVPDRVMRYAVTFDALASASASKLRAGDPAFLSDKKWMTDSRIALRFVRARPRDFAEIKEGGTRAFRTSTSFPNLWAEAATRCGPMEILAHSTLPGTLIDWCVPSVD
jgi:hypothetical protein